MSGRAGSPGPSARQELSIDFFVGSARPSIFVDRVPGGALSHFLPRNLGFSSALVALPTCSCRSPVRKPPVERWLMQVLNFVLFRTSCRCEQRNKLTLIRCGRIDRVAAQTFGVPASVLEIVGLLAAGPIFPMRSSL
jgi:hypothetical protein